ncbi:PspA/IM30 family protein [Gordonia terrae]
MTILGEAVRAELERRGLEIGLARVEKILLDADVSSTASRGVPARLRVKRLQVSGTKQYSETPGEETAPAAMKTALIDLNWTPGAGVNGVGSEANLRGKSSVLHLTMWALTGRSHLQADVISWVDHVNAEFEVDGVPLYVEFDVTNGMPAGKVEQRVTTGSRTVLGAFSGHAEFESVMGSVMLERLRLDAISVFSKGVETEHTWPSYAAALTVHADRLDPIIGNENTLKTRILQMFVGTSWAAVDAQVATALNSLTYADEESQARRTAAASVTATAVKLAEDRVARAKKLYYEFDPTEPDVDTVFALASSASDRAREAHDLSLKLMTARNAAAEVRSQLRTEEMRQQAAAEDAVARRMFNGMTPSVCPRCSSRVTAERYAAEATDHECSLCLHEFDLDEDRVIKVDGPHSDGGEEPEGDADELVEEVVDPLQALREAVADSTAGVTALQQQHQQAETERVEAEKAAVKGREKLDSARARLRAEFELARAQSALETLQNATTQPIEPANDDELVVLRAASAITKKWVRDDQGPLLESVSDAIAILARRFGSTNIAGVKLKGNGNMDVFKGGADTTYSGLTNGEKLRIKLAAVIALIELGHRDGVGRHPGLLFVDSPAAEEIPEADLKIMLEAMTAVAGETDLQIVVATTHGPMLNEVLPEPNLLVATGTDFVW